MRGWAPPACRVGGQEHRAPPRGRLRLTPPPVAEGYFYGPLDLAFDDEGRPDILFHLHESAEDDLRKGTSSTRPARRGLDGGDGESNGHDGWDSAIAIGADSVVHSAGVDPTQFNSDVAVEYYERNREPRNRALQRESYELGRPQMRYGG